MEESTKVFIKRIPPTNNFTAASAANGAIFDNLKFTLCLPVDKNTGRIKSPVEGWSKEDIAEFEEECGFTPGYLKSEDFLTGYKIVIPQKGKWLMLDEPRHKLEHMVLCMLPNVAKNSTEVPRISVSSNEAIFVMTNSQDEARLKNSKTQTKIKAFKKFNEMGPDEMKDVLIFLGKNAYTMSAEVVETMVGEEIELNPARFIQMVESDNFQDAVFVNKCIFHGVLGHKGKGISHGGEIIATNLEGAINFLNEPKHQTLKLAILSELEEKQKVAEAVVPVAKKSAGRPKTNV